MENKRISRRDFCSDLLKGAGMFIPNFPIRGEKKENEAISWNPIYARKGDTLKGICWFYGLTDADIDLVVEKNKIINPNLINLGQEIFLPVPQNTLIFPIKNVCFPLFLPGFVDPVTPVITGGLNEWNENPDLHARFAYCDNLEWPYAIFGHTSIQNPQGGLFGPLRSLKKGDILYFSRDYLWEEKCLRGVVEKFGKVSNDQVALAATNSHRLSLITCYTETQNSEDRWAVLVRIVDYFALKPK